MNMVISIDVTKFVFLLQMFNFAYPVYPVFIVYAIKVTSLSLCVH